MTLMHVAEMHIKEKFVPFFINMAVCCCVDLQTFAHLLLWLATARTISRCGTMTDRLTAVSSSSTAAAEAMTTDFTPKKLVNSDVASASLLFPVLVSYATLTSADQFVVILRIYLHIRVFISS